MQLWCVWPPQELGAPHLYVKLELRECALGTISEAINSSSIAFGFDLVFFCYPSNLVMNEDLESPSNDTIASCSKKDLK